MNTALTPLLDVRGLQIGFGGRTVVHGIDFQIAPGEKLALVGESGSGKSVTSLTLMGLHARTSQAQVTGQAWFVQRDGRKVACGIVAKGGRVIRAKAILSNANIKNTIFRLAGAENFPADYVRDAEAVRINTPVTLCPSDDGVNCTETEFQNGWIVRTGPRTNDAAQLILQDTLPRTLIRIDATSAATRRFTYLPNGLPASNFAGATVEVCPTNAGFDYMVRELVINRTGRITLKTSDDGCSI